MLHLAFSLNQYCGTREQENSSKEHHFLEESLSLCERILEDCTTDSIRHGAIQILCTNYPSIGQKEQAINLAKSMPDFYSCQETLLSMIYDGTTENVFDSLRAYPEFIALQKRLLENRNQT